MGIWPQVSMNVPEGYSKCFGCGQDNPHGLKLKFAPEGQGVKAVFTPDERYQGWPGYLHGGIVGCLLDEAVGYAASSTGVRVVTAKLEIRLKRLTPINGPLTVTGYIVKKTRKVMRSAAVVSLADGTVVAEADATQFVVETTSIPGHER
ncbi:MAG: PaaI family thioesterase [Dehalococcoidia bacterium]|nr:PaaI family thioesterase [Dehalococcoidia bacterium]